jgi:peptide deformylase
MNAPETPEGWHPPTPLTLDQYSRGIEAGLVPPYHPALQQEAEPVAIDEITGAEALGILRRMREVVGAMAEDRLVGLAAPQIGEAAQIVFVPGEGGLMTVFNPSLQVDETVPREEIPHGCFSSPGDMWARFPSAQAQYLRDMMNRVPQLL